MKHVWVIHHARYDETWLRWHHDHCLNATCDIHKIMTRIPRPEQVW